MARINTMNYHPVTAWNGTQDLFVVEQPDGTKVATPEQIRQYILSNMDDAPTAESENIVSSGGVAASLSKLFKKGMALSASGENTIVSTKSFDTICIIGGFGSSVVFDVIFLNNPSGVLKLGHTGSVITSIDRYSVKYKAGSVWAAINAFSLNDGTLSSSVDG